VPLLVRGPGFRGGHAVSAPVANTDLAATIVGLADADPGIEIDGVPLEDALEPEGEDRAVLLEVFERKADQFTGLRTAAYAYAERAGEAELYDLAVDPYELENVAGDPRYADVEAELSARLAEMRDCAGQDCR
jgi:arylsulfatase A-like enzyme